MMTDSQWVVVESGTAHHTSRLEVPGGWLYRYGYRTAEGDMRHVMAFVPMIDKVLTGSDQIDRAPRNRPILVDVIGTGPNRGLAYGWHIAEWKDGAWSTGALMMSDMHRLRSDEISRWCELPD